MATQDRVTLNGVLHQLPDGFSFRETDGAWELHCQILSFSFKLALEPGTLWRCLLTCDTPLLVHCCWMTAALTGAAAQASV